jgi:hypothetical protein
MRADNSDVKKYIEKYPNLNASKLARLIIKEHPEAMLSFHTLRIQISTLKSKDKGFFKFTEEPNTEILGEVGVYKKGKLQSTDVPEFILKKLEENQKEIDRLRDLVSNSAQKQELIKTRGHVNKPVEESGEGLHLVVGCLHMPFHNKYMWDAILGICNTLGERLTSICLIGDISDMHSISRHSKGKITIPHLTLEAEYEATNKELNNLDAILHQDTRKHFLYGNHEDWYHQHMAQVDNYKLGDGVIQSPAEALGYIDRGYTVQTNWKDAYIRVGDIELIHGTYCNVHSAKKHLDVMKRNVAYVHTHSIGSYTEYERSAYNIGWGGDKNAPVFGYMTRIQKEKWRNGFALIYVDSNGISHLQQLELINNKIHFEGKLYG